MSIGVRQVAAVLILALSAACSAPSGQPGGPTVGTELPPIAPSRLPSPDRTSRFPAVPATLPPSQVAIEPGTYRWDQFSPPMTFDVGPGWQVGHRHPEFLDLFVNGDFPAVSFGRFSDVFADPTLRVPASDANSVVASLSGYQGVTLSEVEAVTLAGLSGRRFTLLASVDQTPLFAGSTGVFKMDPGFVTRYTVLDLPEGGTLIIGEVAREGELDGAIEAAASILASLAVGDS